MSLDAQDKADMKSGSTSTNYNSGGSSYSGAGSNYNNQGGSPTSSNNSYNYGSQAQGTSNAGYQGTAGAYGGYSNGKTTSGPNNSGGNASGGGGGYTGGGPTSGPNNSGGNTSGGGGNSANNSPGGSNTGGSPTNSPTGARGPTDPSGNSIGGFAKALSAGAEPTGAGPVSTAVRDSYDPLSSVSPSGPTAPTGGIYGAGNVFRQPTAYDNLRGVLGPNAEPRYQPTTFGSNYQTAQLLRDAYPNIGDKYSQEEVTNALQKFSQAVPGEAGYKKFGNDAMNDIARVGLNQMVGGYSPTKMLRGMDTTGMRPATVGFDQPGPNSMGMVKVGSAPQGLATVALREALMGQGVSPQAMNASNFVADGTKMVKGVDTIGSAGNGTTFGADPTWGDRIENRNVAAADNLKQPTGPAYTGNMYAGPGAPASQSPSIGQTLSQGWNDLQKAITNYPKETVTPIARPSDMADAGRINANPYKAPTAPATGGLAGAFNTASSLVAGALKPAAPSTPAVSTPTPSYTPTNLPDIGGYIREGIAKVGAAGKMYNDNKTVINLMAKTGTLPDLGVNKAAQDMLHSFSGWLRDTLNGTDSSKQAIPQKEGDAFAENVKKNPQGVINSSPSLQQAVASAPNFFKSLFDNVSYGSGKARSESMKILASVMSTPPKPTSSNPIPQAPQTPSTPSIPTSSGDWRSQVMKELAAIHGGTNPSFA